MTSAVNQNGAAFPVHPQNVSAVFMVLLVSWNMAEFAFQTIRRPFGDEVRVFIATAIVLLMIPFVRTPASWAAKAALGIGLAWCVFGTIGIYFAGANEGFGKAGQPSRPP